MTWVRFRLGLPSESWLAEASRTHPKATIKATGVRTETTGAVLLRVAGTAAEHVADTLREHPAVEAADPLDGDGSETTVHVVGDLPPILDVTRRTGLPTESPARIIEGVATVEVIGDHDRLSLLGRRLARAGVDVTVDAIGRDGDATRLLTDTQRELVHAAVEAGYYHTPRRCTLTELAERQGIAKSTCSETLQRAEERLMSRFVDEGVPRSLLAEIDAETAGAGEDAPADVDSGGRRSGDEREVTA